MNAHVKSTTAQPCLPPPVGIPRQHGDDPTAWAIEDRHPLAHLMRLRDEAAAQIERLVAFLDATDGDIDLEPYLTGWNGYENDDREGDPADDEPSLGWTQAGAIGADDDLELDEVMA